jgi:hypothetical protein
MIVASVTRNPAPVAIAAFSQQVPWLLFGLVSGVYVDPLDRRKLIVSANVVRAACLGALAAAAALGAVSLPLIYVSSSLSAPRTPSLTTPAARWCRRSSPRPTSCSMFVSISD